MKTAKRLLACLLLLTMAVIAGCSTSGDKKSTDATPAAKPEAKPVELNIWGGYPEIDALYAKVGDEYKKLHPNVTVKVLSMPLRDYEKKLAAALPSDSGPDILHSDLTLMGRFIDAGLMAQAPDAISTYVKGTAYGPFEVERVSYKGAVYSVPFFKGQSALYYNLDAFKEAGLTAPPKTMDEVIQYAQKLAKKDASGNLVRPGISLRLTGGGSGLAEKFWILMEQSGGSIVVQTKAGKYHNGYNNDAGRKTLQMYVDLVQKYKADDPKLKHDAEAFELGVAAMFFRESWVVGDIAKKAPGLKYATARMPVAAIALPQNLFVPKASKNADVAWDFIKFLVNEQHQKQLLDEVGWLPMRRDVDYSEIIKKFPGFNGFMVKDADYRYFSPPIGLKEFDEIETKLATKLEAAFADPSLKDNPAAVAKAIQAMADETDAILKAANMYGND